MKNRFNEIKIESSQNICEDSSYLNSLKGIGYFGENRVAPLVTQVRTAYFSMDCGMCYVIRLFDGRFVILDANTGEYEENQRLFDVLNSQNVNEKIIIAAWFFSHAHLDHIGGFADFVTKYKNEIVLQNVLYSWPMEDKVYPLNEVGKAVLNCFEEKISEIKGETAVHTPHTQEEYNFGGVNFKVLFTCADLYPEFIPNFNDSSLVFMADFSGRKILFLGDAQKQASDCICQNFETKELECELLQVGHHGYSGGSDALYKAANPDALLWPCPNFWFPVIKYWEPNDFLLTSPKIKHTYLSGREQITIDLTKPLPEFEPYKEYNFGEKIYSLDLNSEKFIDLNLSCITGGATGYKPAKATFQNGTLTLETVDSESHTVCEFAQGGLLRKNPCYTLEFSGETVGEYGEFGLFFDYEKPTVFNEDKVLRLTPKINEKFTYTLKCNGIGKEAELYLNGELICRVPCEYIGGLHFILKNAKIKLDNVVIIKD